MVQQMSGLLTTRGLPYIRLPELAPLTLTLKMATAMSAETLVNTQHSMWLTPESQSYTC
jgi:hypothetical protein